jgi:Fe-S-cluster containining protein
MTAATLREGIRLRVVIDAAADAAAYADEAIAIVRDAYQPPLECREGCSYCCHQPDILTTIPELLRIVDVVHQSFDNLQLEALRERARGYAEHNQGRALGDLAREVPIACPLLVDNRCSVYDARPLTCRGYNSLSVDACRGDYEDGVNGPGIPVFPLVKDAADGVLVGCVQALAAGNANDSLVDLGCALNIALGDENSLEDEIGPRRNDTKLAAVENRIHARDWWNEVQAIARQLGVRT